MSNKTNNIFGGWAIEEELFNKIREILSDGSTILEFGSGIVSEEFSKYYNVYSVEHNKEWVNKYNTNYIHAPLIKYDDLDYPWYDTNILKKDLPKDYDLILVDGPPAGRNITARHGFYYNLDLFNLKDKILIFDDIEREGDYNHIKLVAEKLNKPFEIYKYNKSFGIIYT